MKNTENNLDTLAVVLTPAKGQIARAVAIIREEGYTAKEAREHLDMGPVVLEYQSVDRLMEIDCVAKII